MTVDNVVLCAPDFRSKYGNHFTSAIISIILTPATIFDMAHSGVAVEDEVVLEYNNIKLRHMYQYVQLRLSDDMKRIQIDKCVEKCDYEDFVSQLPPADCRYAIFDFHYSLGPAAGERQQLLFVVWSVHV